jgi:hypothetical protein
MGRNTLLLGLTMALREIPPARCGTWPMLRLPADNRTKPSRAETIDNRPEIRAT